MYMHRGRLCVIQSSRLHHLCPSGAHSQHMYIMIMAYVPYKGNIRTKPNLDYFGVQVKEELHLTKVTGKDVYEEGKFVS